MSNDELRTCVEIVLFVPGLTMGLYTTWWMWRLSKAGRAGGKR